MTVICIGLFVARWAERAGSAARLADSMEGDMISALIHAATMVTAGIFMVARRPALRTLDPRASFVVVITPPALFLGILGIVAHDIKRVVAYRRCRSSAT
jgi:NADH-quinone oxidoreductase subunit L